MACRWRSEGHFQELLFSYHVGPAWDLNSGPQALGQTHLRAEPSLWPGNSIFNVSDPHSKLELRLLCVLYVPECMSLTSNLGEEARCVPSAAESVQYWERWMKGHVRVVAWIFHLLQETL